MGRRPEQTPLPKRHTNEQQIYEKDVEIHYLLGKCKSKLRWDTNSHLLEWLLSARELITSDGEVVEKKEPSFTAGGNVNWCNHYGKQYGASSEN